MTDTARLHKFMLEYQHAHGVPPTHHEMQRAMNCGAWVIYRLLGSLRSQGRVAQDRVNKFRGWWAIVYNDAKETVV